MSYPVPEHEADRIKALHRLDILDTESEAAFDRVVRVAQQVFDVPNAAVTFVDEDRQWFKATCGLGISETPREDSFCAHVIDGAEVLVVEDARADDRFKGNPFALKTDGIRFYAGAPLTVEDDYRVGTLCVSGPTPRSFSDADRTLLRRLADLVSGLLESRQRTYQVGYLTSALEQIEEAVVVTEGEPIDPPGPRIVWVNEAFLELTGYEREELVGNTPRMLQGPETDRETLDQVRSVLKAQTSVKVEAVNYRKDGTPYTVEWTVTPVRDANGRLTHWVSAQRDVTERRAREDELEHRATYDQLTGLLGREALDQRLDAALAPNDADADDPAADPASGALLFMDLDRFKEVNDSLGHSAGDRLLQVVARRLRSAVRDGDVVARLGGDEFVVWLRSGQTEPEATDVAHRILEAIGTPLDIDGQEVFVGASIGIVPDLSQYESAEAALRDADVAMYEAKDAMTQDVAIHEPTMTEKVDTRLRMDAALRRGVEREEFEPFFLPIVGLEEGRLFGFEVLARWRRPDGELVSPGAFLDVAEETGLIVPIGHQVIDSACAVLHDLRSTFNREWELSLSGNFSRQEFFQPDTKDFVATVLQRYDIGPSDFTMEITERAVGTGETTRWAEVQKLQSLGIRMEIDDFGTGYSSLQSLLKFPVDGFKLDRGLIDEVPESEAGTALVRSVLNLGRQLDLTVTAEGIETEEQLSLLRSFGCAYGQGYLLSPPVAADAVENMIAHPPWRSLWGAESAINTRDAS